MAVREQNGQFFPEGAYYRVEFMPRDVQDAAQIAHFKWRGRVYVASRSEAMFAPLFRTGLSVLIRETGF